MVKTLILVAAFAVSLACLGSIGSAIAQQQAPTGHRQPTASDVPANDSVRGDANLSDQAPDQTSKKRSRTRRVQSNVDVIMKTPNICSNCNQ
jgi:hypothetical protein